MKKHGGYCNYKTTKLCAVWQSMKQRIYNSNNPGYKNYGGRGLKVCDEWNDFISFRLWALTHGYKEGLSIERIDNNKGYYPDNCCFMPRKLNNYNKRINPNHGICGFETGYGIYYKVAITVYGKRYFNKGSMNFETAVILRDELLEKLKPQYQQMKAEYVKFMKQNLLK
jgi:hypothetical protein